jgi:hypothetical protein
VCIVKEVHQPLGPLIVYRRLCALFVFILGATASLSNACYQYGLTEDQVRQANLPCRYRYCHGNPYIVVKLSDMANLKATLQQQAKDAAKQKIIDELGEDGYAGKMAADKAAMMKKEADFKAAKEKKDAAMKVAKEVQKKTDQLSSLLSHALAASEGGLAPTLAGIIITKTAAKKEWHVKPDEIVGRLKPFDPTKKYPKYYLADVIGVAHSKGTYESHNSVHISLELKSSPDRRKFYARYLLDTFHAQCKAFETRGDDAIVEKVRRESKNSIETLIGEHQQVLTDYQERIAKQKKRLSALDRLLENSE